MTAGDDVFYNLILKQSNSVIVLPADRARSPWADGITAVGSEFCACEHAGGSRGAAARFHL